MSIKNTDPYSIYWTDVDYFFSLEKDPTTDPNLPYDYSNTPVEEVLEECLGLVKQMQKLKPRLFGAAVEGDYGKVNELSDRLNRKYKYYERNIAGIKDRVIKIDNFKTQINNIILGFG